MWWKLALVKYNVSIIIRFIVLWRKSKKHAKHQLLLSLHQYLRIQNSSEYTAYDTHKYYVTLASHTTKATNRAITTIIKMRSDQVMGPTASLYFFQFSSAWALSTEATILEPADLMTVTIRKMISAKPIRRPVSGDVMKYHIYKILCNHGQTKSHSNYNSNQDDRNEAFLPRHRSDLFFKLPPRHGLCMRMPS